MTKILSLVFRITRAKGKCRSLEDIGDLSMPKTQLHTTLFVPINFNRITLKN